MRHNGAVSHKLSLKKSLKMWYTIKYGGHTSTIVQGAPDEKRP